MKIIKKWSMVIPRYILNNLKRQGLPFVGGWHRALSVLKSVASENTEGNAIAIVEAMEKRCMDFGKEYAAKVREESFQ